MAKTKRSLSSELTGLSPQVLSAVRRMYKQAFESGRHCAKVYKGTKLSYDEFGSIIGDVQENAYYESGAADFVAKAFIAGHVQAGGTVPADDYVSDKRYSSHQ